MRGICEPHLFGQEAVSCLHVFKCACEIQEEIVLLVTFVVVEEKEYFCFLLLLIINNCEDHFTALSSMPTPPPFHLNPYVALCCCSKHHKSKWINFVCYSRKSITKLVAYHAWSAHIHMCGWDEAQNGFCSRRHTRCPHRVQLKNQNLSGVNCRWWQRRVAVCWIQNLNFVRKESAVRQGRSVVCVCVCATAMLNEFAPIWCSWHHTHDITVCDTELLVGLNFADVVYCFDFLFRFLFRYKNEIACNAITDRHYFVCFVIAIAISGKRLLLIWR